jgi:hypothetical protein
VTALGATSIDWVRANRTWLWRAGSALALAYLAVRWTLLVPNQGGIHGVDARTYWAAPLLDPYGGVQIGLPGAYLYSPAFLQALAPARLLPWEVFHAAWTGLSLAALVYLVGPMGGALALAFLPFVFRDVFVGNIHLMMGAAIVLGLRIPAAWSFLLLTKVTPGVGVLWFAARREWRRFAIAVGVTGVIAFVSFAIAPGLWFEWVARLRGDTGTAGNSYMIVLVVRVALAAALVAFGALTNRAWLVPIAALMAIPILWPDSLALLLAAPRLVRSPARSNRAADRSANRQPHQ